MAEETMDPENPFLKSLKEFKKDHATKVVHSASEGIDPFDAEPVKKKFSLQRLLTYLQTFRVFNLR